MAMERRTPVRVSDSQIVATHLSKRDYRAMIEDCSYYVIRVTLKTKVDLDISYRVVDDNIKYEFKNFGIFRILHFNNYDVRAAEQTLSKWYHGYEYSIDIERKTPPHGYLVSDKTRELYNQTVLLTPSHDTYSQAYSKLDNPSIKDAITSLLTVN